MKFKNSLKLVVFIFCMFLIAGSSPHVFLFNNGKTAFYDNGSDTEFYPKISVQIPQSISLPESIPLPEEINLVNNQVPTGIEQDNKKVSAFVSRDYVEPVFGSLNSNSFVSSLENNKCEVRDINKFIGHMQGISNSKIDELVSRDYVELVKTKPANDIRIDALIYDYRFADTKLYYRFDDKVQIDSAYKLAVYSALKEWGTRTGLEFTERTVSEKCEPVHIIFSRHKRESGKPSGYVSFGKSLWINGKVYAEPNYASVEETFDDKSFRDSNFGYNVILHESGHAIWLKHPGRYNIGEQGPFLPTHLDNKLFTIMSYNSAETQKHSLGMFDIKAVKYLYFEDKPNFLALGAY